MGHLYIAGLAAASSSNMPTRASSGMVNTTLGHARVIRARFCFAFQHVGRWRSLPSETSHRSQSLPGEAAGVSAGRRTAGGWRWIAAKGVTFHGAIFPVSICPAAFQILTQFDSRSLDLRRGHEVGLSLGHEYCRFLL